MLKMMKKMPNLVLSLLCPTKVCLTNSTLSLEIDLTNLNVPDVPFVTHVRRKETWPLTRDCNWNRPNTSQMPLPFMASVYMVHCLRVKATLSD